MAPVPFVTEGQTYLDFPRHVDVIKRVKKRHFTLKILVVGYGIMVQETVWKRGREVDEENMGEGGDVRFGFPNCCAGGKKFCDLSLSCSAPTPPHPNLKNLLIPSLTRIQSSLSLCLSLRKCFLSVFMVNISDEVLCFQVLHTKDNLDVFPPSSNFQ
jgi:hypothetical protein